MESFQEQFRAGEIRFWPIDFCGRSADLPCFKHFLITFGSLPDCGLQVLKTDLIGGDQKTVQKIHGMGIAEIVYHILPRSLIINIVDSFKKNMTNLCGDL